MNILPKKLRLSRLLAILAVLTVAFTAAGVVSAAEVRNNMTVIEHATVTGEGNVTYESADVVFHPHAAAAGENTFTTLDEAAACLRAQMVARQVNCTVTIKGAEATSCNYSKMFVAAIAHTGVPDEGDYIHKHCGGYSVTTETGFDGYDDYRKFTFSFTWYTTREMEDEMDAAIAELLDSLNLDAKDDYTKIRTLYDYICDNMKYDYDGLEAGNTKLIYTAYAAMINKTAVCQGFASLYYRLCLEMGIDCRVVSGYGEDERHAWNITRLGDVYYNMDTTWDLGISVYYRYFLCTKNNFVNHTRDDEFNSAEFNAEYPMADVPYGIVAEASGRLTSGHSWYLDKNGTLTVEGNGAMTNFGNLGAPWYPYAESIKKIVLSEGITAVGNYAFVRCKNATEVVWPSTLKEIRYYAFDNCRSLKKLELPYGVTTLGTKCFSECMALTRVELPDSITTVDGSVFALDHNITYVKLSAGMYEIPNSMFFAMNGLRTVIIPNGIVRIGDTAFRDCKALTSVTIPAQITFIGTAAFSDCPKLTSINVDPANLYFTSVNGVLYSKDMKTLICYPGGKYGSYSIPEGVTHLAYGSFGSSGVTSVTFPSTLKVIDTYSFAWCKYLSNAKIPASVTTVGNTAFGWCTNLRSVTFANPNTTLDWHVFDGCTSLTSVTLPSNLKELNTGLFDDCTALTSITIPNSVTRIGDSAFSGCTGLKNLTLHANIHYIGYDAFWECKNLERLTVKGDIYEIDFRAFKGCTSLSVIRFCGTVSGVDSTAFSDITLKAVYFDSQTAVNGIYGSGAFGGLLKNAKSIGVAQSVTTIPSYVKNNFTYKSAFSYEGQSYYLYSDHKCSWYSNKCYYCKAIRDYELCIHNYDSLVIAPTCINWGYTYYWCNSCGSVYEDNYVDPIGHDYDYVITPPTCYSWGYTEYTCMNCGDWYESDYTSPVDHEYTAVTTPPTCTEQGYTAYTCDMCGDYFEDNYVEATGHDFSHNFVCAECGYVAKVSILGDSISTYSGISIVKNPVYPNTTVKSVEDTWWQQVINAMGAQLLVNNASGGSRILSDEYFNGGGIRVGNYAAYRDRCVNLHNGEDKPDVIFVFMGTNDFSYHVDSNCEKCQILLNCSECMAREDGNLNVCSQCRSTSGINSSFCNLPLGTADSVNASAEVPASTCEAYAIMLNKMKEAYPNAQIYCMGLLPRVTPYQKAVYHDHGQPTAFNTELKKVAESAGARFISLEQSIDNSAATWNTYFGDAVHPTNVGMARIAGTVIADVMNKEVYTVSFQVADNTANLDGEFWVISGNAYEANVVANTDLELDVLVVMNDTDITETAFDTKTGKIYVSKVTGNILITVKVKGIVWSIGTVSTINGSDADEYKNRIRTNYIALDEGVMIRTTNDAEVNVVYYDSSYKILSTDNNTGWIKKWDSGSAPAAAVYVRVVARATNGMNLTTDYRKNITIICGHTHSYTATVTPPTCTEQGYTAYTCDMCGDYFEDNYVEATGHSYKNGVCKGCGDVATLAGKTLSILGASISTYTGISNNTSYNATIGKNAVYYTEGRHGVYANDTWWMQAANDLGLRLLVNNSWSGSALLHERNGTVGAYVNRCVQLHNNQGEEPDLIAIQMGSNDFQYYKDTLGTADIDYAALIKENADGTFTYATPVTSLEAAAIVLHKISVRYPNAEVYYLNVSQRVDNTDELIRFFNGELKQVVEHFGASIVDIYGSAITMKDFDTYIGDGKAHPNKMGMDAYTEAFKRAVVANTNYAVTTHTVSMQLDDVTADYGDDKIVVSGDSYVLNLTTSDALDVTVIMGGEDITQTAYHDGKVTIDAVTADVVITAKSVHQNRDYCWEFNGTDLTGENTLTKISGTTTDGVFSNTYYALKKEVVLYHDQPWTVEWVSKGTFVNSDSSTGARIFTSTDKNATYNARYIFKSNKNGIVAMGEKTTTGSHNYGIALGNHGIDWVAKHTYRLENRIADNGSNMVYLFVDGREIGPMNHYYVGTTDQNTTSDWLSGKDFVFPYMGTDTHGFTNAAIEYIAVWEGGHTHTYENGICTGCRMREPHTHSYTATVTPPTCTEQGFTTHTCRCGDSYVDTYTPAKGHSFGDWIVTKAPACTESGTERRDCANCEHYETRTLSALGHTEVIDKAVAATCTASGLTEGKHCSVCGEILVAQQTIPAKGHSFGDWTTTKAPTCTASGTERRDCANCDHYETRTLPALGHTEVIDKEVAATCTATGLTEGKHCSVCGEILVVQQTIPAKGHSFGNWTTTKTPTCTESGTERRDCANCDHYETRTLPALGHTEVIDKAVAATCTATGLTEGKHCSVCGEILVAQQTLPAKGHSFGNWTTTKAPTCTESGTEGRDCANCDHYETRTLPALGHTEVIDKAVAATCTATGLTEGKHCSVCGEVLVPQQTIPAKGHSFGNWTTTKTPTCTATGTERRDCANCDHYETRTLPALGHTEVIDKAVAATCTTTGLTEGKHCSVCGEILVAQQTIPAKGHSFGDWVITKPATEDTEGLKERTCSACSLKETASVPKLDHVHDYTAVVTAPTCTEQGFTTHTCRCGDSYVDTYTPAKGHSFGSWTTTKAPTCTASGTERRDCANCDHYETRVVNALGHTEVTDKAVAATCTKSGLTEGKHCSVCGEIFVAQQTIPAKGHSFGDWVITKPATEDTEGLKERTCSACSFKETASVPKLDHVHEYTAVVTAPTCTEQGYTTHICRCGDSYVDTYTPAKGHSFGNWTITKTPTCTASGTERRDCANCEHYETRTLPALGHTEVTDKAVDATCTASGLTEGKHCSVCGEILVVQQTIPAKGHSFGDWVITKPATEDNEGLKERTCSACSHKETASVPKLDHVHDYSAVVTAPTCTEQGFTTHTCRCGDSYVDTYTPAKGHSFDDWTVIKTPTCTASGTERRDCTNCEHYETRTLSALGHTEAIDKAVAATCTATGLTEGKHCSVCGEVLVPQQTIPAKGHSFGDWIVTKAPTCTASGTERRDCANCEHYETRTLPALGHTEVIDKAVAATCTASGLTEGKHCSVCGEILVAQQTIPAKGHSFGDWVITKPATEDTEGLKERTCSACSLKETASVPKLDHVHDYNSVVTEPTCTEQGYTTHTCRCGDSYIDSYENAKGHSFGNWTTTKTPTCTESGTERRDCANCDYYETRVVNALGHTEVIDKAVAATCTASGLTEGKHCSVCGEILVAQQTVPAKGHSFGSWIITKPATEDTEGLKERTCSACSFKETASVPKLDHVHDYTAGVTAPTCTEQGYTTHTCRCGDSYVDTYTPAKGHSFGNWTTTKAPTCTSSGTERRDCTNCEHYETRTLPALGHTEVIDKAVAATCTTTGLTEGKHCSVCGEILVAQQTIPAKGHSFGEWVITKPATEDSEGIKERICSACSLKETASVPKLDHVHDYSEVVTAPTCTEQGYTTHTCRCGDSYVDTYTSAKGHSFGNWTTTKAPTCTATGTERRDCVNCDHYETKVVDALGHTEVIDKAVSATCTATGLTEGKHCSVCGEILVVQQTVPAKGHSFGEWVITKPATEDNEGIKERICSACSLKETASVPKLDHVHDYSEVVTAPTCTEQGYTTHTCRCGDSYVDTYTPAKGHSFGSWTTTKAPTCTTSGTERRDCANCDHYETRTLSALGHTEVIDKAVAATCTATGLTEGKHCSVCGEILVAQQTVPAKGHSFGNWVITKPATEDAEGLKERTCSACSFKETASVPKLDHVHDYSEVVTAPTCTEQGFTTHTCRCGDSYVDTYTPAKGHSFGNWTTTKASTCTASGTERRDCANCDHYETRTLPALGHTEVIDKAVAATCTTSGLTEGKHCSVCGEILVAQQTISALGHDFADEWTVDVEPTTEREGQKSRHCSRCVEVTDIIVIAKLVEIIDTSKKFTDVVESWSKPGIDYVVSYGYMNGTGNGTTFSPSDTMTRAMIVSVLHRIAGKPAPSVKNPFKDLEASQSWYHDAVIWAYENGIVTGTSATTFAPTGAVTREQMATFLYRFAKFMGYDTTASADLSKFPDESKVGSWAYDALAWANAEGLITGAVVNGKTVLNPQGAATREQVATILMRFCQSYES